MGNLYPYYIEDFNKKNSNKYYNYKNYNMIVKFIGHFLSYFQNNKYQIFHLDILILIF